MVGSQTEPTLREIYERMSNEWWVHPSRSARGRTIRAIRTHPTKNVILLKGVTKLGFLLDNSSVIIVRPPKNSAWRGE